MVGVPRSSGCQLCRKRRVKCDEVHPSCGNCAKYGVDCPGYERGMKFVTGKHHIRQRGKTSVSSEPDTASGFSSNSGSRNSNGGSAPTSRASSLQPTDAASSSPDSIMSILQDPTPNRAQFVSTMVSTVRADVSRADVTGFLLWCDLDKLGSRAVLDGSMCSLAMHLVGKETGNQALISNSRSMYATCLSELQASLRHPTEWRTSETLCSAMLLCIFELFAGTGNADSWFMHARGIGTLIEQRGPAAHATGWDASMVLAFRGVLIMCDMFFPRSEECFLATEEWKPIVRDRGRYLLHPSRHSPDTVDIIDEFFERLAEIPSILAPTYMLREARTLGTGKLPKPEKVAALALRAIKYRRLFGTWYEKWTKFAEYPTYVLSTDPDSPFDKVLLFKTPWMGSLYMGYWACMLIIQETLMQSRWPEDFAEMRAEHTRNILHSVETVGAGTMGPYRVGFSVRIAYEVCSTDMQLWIRSQLDRYQNTYAATDSSTYPEPRTDDGGICA